MKMENIKVAQIKSDIKHGFDGLKMEKEKKERKKRKKFRGAMAKAELGWRHLTKSGAHSGRGT